MLFLQGTSGSTAQVLHDGQSFTYTVTQKRHNVHTHMHQCARTYALAHTRTCVRAHTHTHQWLRVLGKFLLMYDKGLGVYDEQQPLTMQLPLPLCRKCCCLVCNSLPRMLFVQLAYESPASLSSPASVSYYYRLKIDFSLVYINALPVLLMKSCVHRCFKMLFVSTL